MDLAFRELGVLAAARRTGSTLDSQKAADATAKAEGVEETDPVPATDTQVSKPLEALRAVIPATMITLYSAIVIPLQGIAINAGADARAKLEAAKAKEFVDDPEGLAAALKLLPVESSAWVELRIAFAIVATLAVLIFAYRKAQTVPGKRVILEPVVTTIAFAAWAAASPGSPLAAFLKADEYQVYTLAIAGFTALLLFALSNTTLSKKDTTT